jgi:hypothetical protein
MAIKSVRCSVLGANITRVTDLEGTVTRIICPQYDDSKGGCRLRSDAFQGGPLSQLLTRVEEDTLDSPAIRCRMH